MALPSKRELVARSLNRTGLGVVLRRLHSWNGLLVFNYHRVGDGTRSSFDRDVWSGTQEAFADQLRFLKRECEVIGARDLPRVFSHGRGKYAMITFDDGYRDNFELALPVLKECGLTATFFVTTGFLDDRRPSWWDEIAWMVRHSPLREIPASRLWSGPLELDAPDRSRAIRTLLETFKRLPGERSVGFLDCLAEASQSGRCPVSEAEREWMTWDMVRGLHAAGMTIGGHTVNHPVLARLPAEEQTREIEGCRKRLELELGIPMQCFSYPVGKPGTFDAHTRAALQAAGVKYGFSYYGGIQPLKSVDPLDIHRIAVDHDLSRDMFRAIVALPSVLG